MKTTPTTLYANQNDLATLVNVTAKGMFSYLYCATQFLTSEGESFYNQFFKALDDYRQNLFQFFRPDSAIVWCGNPIGGGDAFIQMYSQMPMTKHDVGDYNVHPLPNTNNAQGQLTLTLNVSGKVKFGTERGKDLHGFSAVFMLRREGSGQPVTVTSMSYRLVHRPEDATLEI